MSPPTDAAASTRALACFRLPAAGGTAKLMLVGELDLVTADHARQAIRQAQGAAAELICDLGDVWFVDLSGLRVLIDATERARATGGGMIVANCPPIVPRMLRLLGLQDALELRGAGPAAVPYVPSPTQAD